MSKKNQSNKREEKAEVHEELEGFDIRVNSFGQLETSFDIDKLNAFLDQRIEKKERKKRSDKS